MTQNEHDERVRAYLEKIRNHPGNAEAYSLSNYKEKENSKLKGKTILFLGSSVTLGAASLNESFADDLQVLNGIHKIKEAVNGTTLVNDGIEERCYIERMHTMDPSVKADAFMCQLSTNDATKNKKLGSVSASFDRSDFDQSTIAGAIEYIISYAKQTWKCPVTFYTGTAYDSELYGQMVNVLKEIAEKWEIQILNLWDDEEMKQVSEEDYALYMNDPIHPTRCGYLQWWYPKFEMFFEQLLQD